MHPLISHINNRIEIIKGFVNEYKWECPKDYVISKGAKFWLVHSNFYFQRLYELHLNNIQNDKQKEWIEQKIQIKEDECPN